MMEPMTGGPTDDVTRILEAAAGGDPAASERLAEHLGVELHRLAEVLLSQRGMGHTLQATELVNEAWMKLFGGLRRDWDGRRHFLSVAAKAMRSILVDRARKRNALKRAGNLERVPLDAVVAAVEERQLDLVALDEALVELAKADERAASVVELRFFAGLSNEEAAQTLGVGLRTVERSWRTAKAWLAMRLEQAGES